MMNQSKRILTETPAPEPGRRFKLRYETCRTALVDRTHAPARLLTVASISDPLLPGAIFPRANKPLKTPQRPSLASEPAASLFLHTPAPQRQPQSQAMLTRQALGSLR